jgi:hypothetical protein
MLGSWETSYIKIKMLTFQKSDSLHIIENNFSKSDAGKAQSTYKKDGTFTAWFQLANGEKTGLTTGTWKTKNDSLYVDYFYLGKQIKTSYYIQQTNNNQGFEGKNIYDWDGDGTLDDHLVMQSKRIEIKN